MRLNVLGCERKRLIDDLDFLISSIFIDVGDQGFKDDIVNYYAFKDRCIQQDLAGCKIFIGRIFDRRLVKKAYCELSRALWIEKWQVFFYSYLAARHGGGSRSSKPWSKKITVEVVNSFLCFLRDLETKSLIRKKRCLEEYLASLGGSGARSESDRKYALRVLFKCRHQIRKTTHQVDPSSTLSVERVAMLRVASSIFSPLVASDLCSYFCA